MENPVNKAVDELFSKVGRSTNICSSCGYEEKAETGEMKLRCSKCNARVILKVGSRGF